MLKRLLAHPLTRGLDLDDPRTTELRKRIIQEKPFLRRIYQEWYCEIAAALPPVPGTVLELGSGAGFLRAHVPDLVTSDLLAGAELSVVLDAHVLPFKDRTLRAIVMTNVLHHMAAPREFFAEAARCVRPQGALIMVEPWVTSWSGFVYRRLHHELYDPDASAWECAGSGPLTRANVALPWILFSRDRDRFAQEFPEWEIRSVEPGMPFRYLLSGGVSLRSLMPGWSFSFWRRLERAGRSWMDSLGMFARCVLTRRGPPRDGTGQYGGEARERST